MTAADLARGLLPAEWWDNYSLSRRWDFDAMSWVFTYRGRESMRIPGDHPHLADADASGLGTHANGHQWEIPAVLLVNPHENLKRYRVFRWVSGNFMEIVR